LRANVSVAGFQGKDMFISVSFNGTDYECIINGVVTTVTIVAAGSYSVSSGDLKIGGYNETIQLLNADVNLLRVYKRVLTLNEKKEHYNNGLPHFYMTENEEDLTLEMLSENYDNYILNGTSGNNNKLKINNEIHFVSSKYVPKINNKDVETINFTNGFVNIPAENNIFPNTNFSFETFIELNDINTIGNIFNTTSTGNFNIITNGGNLDIAIGGVVSVVRIPASQFLNELKHLIVTFDGTNHKVYIDGVDCIYIIK
jgi:hypothetical protein